MKKIILFLVATALLLSTLPGHAAYDPSATPKPLAEWADWIRAERPDAACVLASNSAHHCVWPKSLQLNVNDSGGKFTLEVDLYRRTQVILPGDDNHWPLAVTDQTGTSLNLFRYNNAPAVVLDAGNHTINGRFEWGALPKLLSIPRQTGLLSLTRHQQVVPRIEVDRDTLRLQGQVQEIADSEADDVNVRVYRLLQDGIPMALTTRIHLDVSGTSREIQLEQVLPQHFKAQSVQSNLAARINADNTLTALVKPGRWHIDIQAYSLQNLPPLSANINEALWPEQEIWSFAADTQYRNANISGAPTVDPAQAQVPAQWVNHPAYLLNHEHPATLEEISRISGERKNKLTLNKKLWLDFNGAGFTIEDTLTGELGPNARLNVVEAYQLGSASTPNQPLVVSQLNDQLGVEVRQQSVNLSAVGRMPRQSSIPVSGWDESFESVSSQLFLPPGWSILATSGADNVSGVWIDRFNLWDIFLILIIAVAVKRVGGWRAAALALFVVVLTYQRQGAPLIIWLNFAICIALAQHVKDKWHQRLSYYTLASFALFAVIMLPFAINQARMVAYPQLEHSQINTLQAPHAEKAQSADKVSVVARTLEEKVVDQSSNILSSIRYAEAPAPQKEILSTEYDAQQQVQAGPPRMKWQWNSARLNWTGPVTHTQTLTLLMVPPILDKLGHLLALLSPLLLAWLLWLKSPRPSLPQLPRSSVAAVLALIVGSGWTPAPEASVVIDNELLDDLRERLFATPDCHPSCAVINSTLVQAHDQQVTVQLEVSAQALTTLSLPELGYNWPQQVTLNNKAATLQRADLGFMLAVPKGRHQVVLSGQVPSRQTLDLNFSTVVHNVTTELDGWSVNLSQKPGRHLQLNPVQTQTNDQVELQPNDIAPFIRVERHIQLEHDWMVHTRVYRMAPSQGGINASVPLLPGEQPLSDSELIDGAMPVQLAPTQRSVEWRSRLEPNTSLELTAADANSQRYEVWQLSAAPKWHVKTTSEATKLLQGDQVKWLPRPGDNLTLEVSRPTPVEGATLALSELTLGQTLGKGLQTNTLNVSVQTYQAGKFEFQLPSGAELTRLHVNGREQPSAQQSGKLAIPVSADTQNVELQWQSPSELSLLTKPKPIRLDYPFANAEISITLPSDRWVLWVSGPQIGPAVLLWSIVAVVLLLAIALAKTKLTPLRTWEWILLSLGIVTMNALLLLIIAACFIALTVRGRTACASLGNNFNVMQVFLIIFSVVSLLLLLVTIPYGLLAQPQMLVQGNGSSNHLLHWFIDQGAGSTPQVTIISLPLWAYRLVMLLWSLWLAFALTGWLRWGWQQLSNGGIWHSQSPPAKAPVAPSASQDKTSLELDLPEDK
ncbi:hypothetical protein KO507_11750 [Gilvimarinus agarilyticus]|uniref:hypothetical protein n=1 Tax=Gilvimarinus sp. 2_MG-2023 TaxID=3062666 RepID=UPI001C0944F2|nr:hypothetical protein [Gilvimarinus sp. 2_MG-2023]MBU2886438.1 hypothetical protein [Gilvimarinus agarilyticus]MDO6571117.1 hypothetical protein [Gilvimarinus sp. 2_MG-2023]